MLKNFNITTNMLTSELTSPDSIIISVRQSVVIVRLTFDPAYCILGASPNILTNFLSTCKKQ